MRKFFDIERNENGQVNYIRILWVLRLKIDNGYEFEDKSLEEGPTVNTNGLPMSGGVDVTGHTFGH